MARCVRSISVSVLFSFVLIHHAWAQTNPAPQPLPYTQDFGATTFTALPAGFAVWNGVSGLATATQQLAETSVPTGNGTVGAATGVQTTGGAYGYAVNTNAQLYIQTSGNATNGVNQPVLAINSTGMANVRVSYKITMLAAQTRTVGVVLQYRSGTSGGWTTVNGSAYLHGSADRAVGTEDLFTDLSLPPDAGNQPILQLRWAIWRGTDNTASSGIGLDNISIMGTNGLFVLPPASFKITSITSGKILITWQLPSGAFDSILVFGRNGGPVDHVPSGWGKNYANQSSQWSAAGVYGNSRLLYNGTGTELQIDGLTEGSAYSYQANAFKDTVYSVATVQVTDTASVQGISGLTAIPGDAQAAISWTNYAGDQGMWWDEVLLLANATGPVSAVPAGDGSAYTPGAAFGAGSLVGPNNYVVYKGIGSSMILSGLTNGLTYSLLAAVRNGSVWSAASKVKRTSFVSGQVVVVPATPVLQSPTDGAAGVLLPVTFQWTASVGAVSYRIQVAQDAAFSSLVMDSSGITRTTFQPAGLVVGTTYYWHVRAANTAGVSAYTTPFSFTTNTGTTGGIEQTFYQTAYKLYGTALRQELHNLIKGHTQISYDGLYTQYPVTDGKPGNVVWDMYSDIPGGTPAYVFIHGSKKCGSYGGEGDCYNREHSWPQSWFNSASMPSSDLFNVYPTDGYVNNRRSNYPYGNVGSPTWVSTNGSRLGTSSFPGYNSTVFEPINTYKGDLARSHFYMSVRYYTEDGSWLSGGGTSKSDLLSWYADQLYEWHTLDMVSTKEIDRNKAVYGVQHNRNPFIDHPEFVAEIWKPTMAPAVVSVVNTALTTTVIDFSRYLDSTVAVTAANFVFNHGVGAAAGVQWGVNSDVSKVQITSAPLEPGTDYTILVKHMKSINGIAMNDTTISFRTAGTSSVAEDAGTRPLTTELKQNYPNPFNPTTTIEFRISKSAIVNLKVFDVLGREVAMLYNGVASPGIHAVQFDGSGKASGLYVVRFLAGTTVQSRKIVLTK